MQSNVTLQTPGLYVEPNPLAVPEGALQQASNVVIQRDNVIQPRRGFQLFGITFGSIGDRLKQLFVYKFRLLRHFVNTLQFDNGTQNNSGQENFTSFSGSFTEAQVGLRTKSVESNGNLYLTSSTGIRKLSVSNASQLGSAQGGITQAGGIKALDVTAQPIIQQGNITGFMPQDSTVAYRVVWGTKDLNQNLILGVPSERAEVYLPLQELLVTDFNNTLEGIQNVANSSTASLITNSDYVSSLALPITATADSIQTNMIALATKLDTNLVIADTVSAPLTISSVTITNSNTKTNNTCVVTFSSGNPTNYWKIGSNIYLNGFPAGETGSINGNQVITALNSTTITFVTNATGNSQTFTDSAVTTGTPGVITIPGHGFKNFDPIRFSNVGGALPTGLSAGTPYYAGSVTTNTFAVYSTSNLSTGVNISAASGGGTHTVTYFMPVTNTSINSGDFRAITQPAIPDIPTPDQELVGLQVYLQAIISELQSEPDTYYFTVSSANATVGATYTNNGQTFTITSTISSGTNLFATGTGSPASSGTLTKTSGTGDATITFSYSSLPIISLPSKTSFISPLTITTSANVSVTITLPQGLTPYDFFQVYRSPVLQATGTDVLSELTASDELQQVYEAYPTAAQIAAGFVTFTDIVPDAFLGADLYTNPSSGVGIANANEVPPFALDINKFKNVVFYANTRTKYRMPLNLLGVSQMVADYNNSIIPSITVSDGTTTHTYTFTLGKQQVTQVVTVADSSGSLAGKYFLIYSANSATKYYIWYKVAGVGTDPAVSGATGVLVYLNTNDTNTAVASKTNDALNALTPIDFTSVIAGHTLTITNVLEGYTTNATANTSGFTVTTPTPGQGQRASTNEILLSNLTSPSQATDATARSIVQVLNQDTLGTIYAFYLSESSTVPGEMTLESRSFTTPQFYIIGNDANTGSSFSPNLLANPISITNISIADVITTSTPHGLTTGQQVLISNTNSTPVINGLWTVTYLSPTTFSIPSSVTIAGNQGFMIAAVNAVSADNNAQINNISYSGILQPESVPLPNTLSVGDNDKAILRIFPLRDSLFVFKEDGLWRISGETAPWTVQLFDTSCLLTAPDSIGVAKNVIYGWTTQGILNITEAGVSNPPISRPIDTAILPLTSDNYPNFKTATWGVGYDSDNSYIVYTVNMTTDTEATIAYRYSTLTSSWTTWDKTDTCGIVNITDDKLYLGAGNTNSIEQERKTFSRFDYADWVLSTQLNGGSYFGNKLILPNTSTFNIGDVLVQNQTITIYDFNALLQKINLETGMQSNSITSITTGSTPTITTSGNHLLTTGNYVNISGTMTTPIIDGLYQVTVTGGNTFTVNVSSPVLTSGSTGLVKYDYYNTLKISGSADIQTALNSLATRLNIEPNLIYKQSTVTISSNSAANPTVIHTSTANSLGPVGTTRIVRISGSNSTPSINGDYIATITAATGNTATQFTIPVHVTGSGSAGSVTTLDDYVTGIASNSGTITAIAVNQPSIITSANHGLVSNRYITISGSNSTPVIDGNYLATVIDRNTFSINFDVLIAGTTGSWSTDQDSFPDLQTNYNFIITQLNSEVLTAIRNYSEVTTSTWFETIINNINYSTNTVFTDLTLDFVVGPMSVYQAIPTQFTYSPVTFKDALNLKQISEATLMFENKAFSEATLSFKSDLMPQFIDVPFSGTGNGGFGYSGVFGNNYFGGASNSAPFRTYIPRNVQRCRYIVPQFTHRIALESYSINGLTLTGNIGQSSRAYR